MNLPEIRTLPIDGEHDYTIPEGTSIETDGKRYTLKQDIKVRWEYREDLFAGLHFTYQLHSGRNISVNKGCYATPEDLERSANSLLSKLISESDMNLVFEIRAAPPEEKDNLRAEKKEIDELFEKTKLAA